MSKQREKGSCRDCNLSINLNYLRCLQYDGFIGIEKMKENLARHNCESFIEVRKND